MIPASTSSQDSLQALAMTLLLALILTVLPDGAVAHSAFNYYSTSWGPSDVPNINWRFTEQVPPANFRDRVENGAVQWNNVAGVNFNWVKQTPEYANFNPNPSSCTDIAHEKNGVHYRSVPSGFVAYTYTCSQSSFLVSTQVVFSSSTGWYSGTGATPSGLNDLWSFAAHEFGHATGGWLNNSIGGQFSGSTLCPSNSSKHTMCANLPTGTNWWRSLEFHDGETFGNAY